jgi:hypothetical protein
MIPNLSAGTIGMKDRNSVNLSAFREILVG